MSNSIAIFIGLVIIILVFLAALCWSVIGLMIILFFMPMAAWWQWLGIGILALLALMFTANDQY